MNTNEIKMITNNIIKRLKIISKNEYKPKTKKELQKLIYDDNIDLSNIDTSKIKDMSYLFDGGFKVNNFKGIEKWNVSNVINMNHLFSGYKTNELNLSKWDTSKVKNMSFMFNDCNIKVLKISNWDVSSVIDMSFMFSNSNIPNMNLLKWNVKKVKSVFSMFENFKSNINLSKWELSNKCDIRSMFKNIKLNKIVLPYSIENYIQKYNIKVNIKIKEYFKKINSEFKANNVKIPKSISSLYKEYDSKYDFFSITDKIENIINKSLGKKSKKLISIIDNILMDIDDIKDIKYELLK